MPSPAAATVRRPRADPISAHGRRMTLVATSLGFAVVQLDVSVVNVAVKSIGSALVGGVLIASLGWRAIFFINVPVAAAGVYLTLRWATETSTARERGVDLPGQLTAVVALVALVAATIEGGRLGFGDPLVLTAFAV